MSIHKHNLIINEIDEIDKLTWDHNILNYYGNSYGNTRFGFIYRKLKIGYPRYFEIKYNTETIALFSMVDMLLGGMIIINLPSIVLNLLGKIPQFRTYTFHMQPTIFSDKLPNEINTNQIIETIIDMLLRLSKHEKKNILPTSFIYTDKIEEAIAIQTKYKQYAEIIGTSRLFLSKGYNVPTSVRKISKGKREQVKIGFANTKTQLDEYLNALLNSWKANKIVANDKKYYKVMKDVFGDDVEYAYAYSDRGILAGTGLAINKNNVIEFSMFTTELSREQKLPGGDILKEYLLDYYRKRGIQIYDFNMYAVEAKDSKTENINFFKLKWGGKSFYGVKLTRLNNLMRIIQFVKIKLIGK